MDSALKTLHAQGSKRITLETLQKHCTEMPPFIQGGEPYPCLGLSNGVRWFYDKDRRPSHPAHGYEQKSLAAQGVHRTMLGSGLESENQVVLFEGERDWLTAESLGLDSAVCIGGTSNLDASGIQILAMMKQVICFFDNDDPGQEAAREIGAALKEAGCRVVKIVHPPDAGTDFSDWIEAYDGDDPLGYVLNHITSASQTLTKAEAKKLLKEAGEKKDPKALVSDDFLTPDGDPCILVAVPKDPTHPQNERTGFKTRFCHFDQRRTRENGELMTELLDSYQPEPKADDTGYNKGEPIKLPMRTPLGGALIDKRVVTLPDSAEPHGTSESLWEDVGVFISDYFVCDPWFVPAMIAYTFLSYRWVDADFEVLPYLRVIGVAGSGKTRFSRVMREICCRSLMVTSMRTVHVYRIVNLLAGNATLIFEEFDIGTGDESREWIRMLSAGNQRGCMVPRMGGQRFDQVDFFEIFCPKLFSMTGEFEDPGLARRTITHLLGQVEVPPDKYYEVLPNEFYRRAASLRRRLLGWRFSKFDRGAPEPNADARAAVSGGVWQNLYPLVCMVPEPCGEALEAILSLGRRRDIDLVISKKLTPEAYVLANCLRVQRIHKDPDLIELTHVLGIIQEDDPHDRWPMRRLTSLLRHVGVEVKRTTYKKEPNTWLVVSDEDFKTACATYSVEIETIDETRGDSPEIM